MTPRVLALADDATGALEVGAHFAGAGMESVVSFDPELEVDAAALVIDTETRHADPRAAAAVHRQLAARARPCRFLFKKTDSTLRGNVAAELTALAAALPDRPLVYAPAYPRLGRTVIGGRLHVDGVPLERTAFAHDPREPVNQSSLSELFAAWPDMQCVQALPATLRNGTILVCDGRSDEDLDRAAVALARSGRPHIAAGTGGFAAVWARRIEVARALAAPPPVTAARCLVVCGSLHPASRAQVRRANLPAAGLEQAGRLRELIEAHSWAALVTPEELQPAPPAIGEIVLSALGWVDALVVFGGDTLFSILAAAGVKTVTPIAELLPGVPCSRFQFRGRELGLITKAGGFGPPETLAEIRRKVVA